MNLSLLITMDYENKRNWTLGQNKPNSNPIKPNFQKAQMNVSSLITKDYRKKDDFVVRINKPNSNTISEKPKMNANVFVTKDYKNDSALRPKKTNPNKANFKRALFDAKICNFFPKNSAVVRKRQGNIAYLDIFFNL